MARTMAYINLFGEIYEITDTEHQLERIAQRIGGTCMGEGFSVHRLETLLGNEEIADAIVNGVRFGEKFILEDVAMGYSLVISHEYGAGYDYPTLVAVTCCQTLRAFDGQKILTVWKDQVQFSKWNRSMKKKEVFAW